MEEKEIQSLRRSGYAIFRTDVYGDVNLEYACKRIDKRLLDDETFVLHQITKNEHYEIYKYISPRLKAKKNIGLAVLKVNCNYFPRLDGKLRSNKEIAIYACTKNANNYCDVGKKLRNDKDLALIVLEGRDKYTPLLGDELSKDKDFIFELLCKNPHCFKFVNIELRSDKEFVIKLIKKYYGYADNDYIIPYIGCNLKDDEDIALLVAGCYLEVFKVMEKHFERNDKVVLTALMHYGGTINDVNPEYRNKKEFVLVALKTYPDLYASLSTELKIDSQILDQMIIDHPSYCEKSSLFQFHYLRKMHSQSIESMNLSFKIDKELAKELEEVRSQLVTIKEYLEKQDKGFTLGRKQK